jgi:diadenosine tetraphosphate (Ap4A) HIT family hydrolase
MEDSIFTKIINGDIPGEMVYEDELCAVLLTIEPLTPGHCLVVPKKQIDHLWDMEDSLYQHVLSVAKKMALRLRNAYTYERVGMLVEGFGVPHAHVHVFGYEQPMEPTIVRHVAHKRMATPDELKAEAEKLRT